MGDGDYGGGVARLGRGRAVGRAVVVAEGCAEALFIGRDEAWARGAGWPAGRRARQPLMALGVVVASQSGGAIRGGGTERQDGSGRGRAARRASRVRVERVGTGRVCVALLAGGYESSGVEAGKRVRRCRRGR